MDASRRPLHALACLLPLLVPSPGFPATPAPIVGACFAPGTPDALVEDIERRALALGLELSLAPGAPSFQLGDGQRWLSTATNGGGLAQGDPTTLTWSIVPDGTVIVPTPSIPAESSDPSNVNAWLNGIYGDPATWRALFQQVFDRWSELTGVTYVYEPNDDGSPIGSASLPGVLGLRGDVRISGHRIDGNYGVLAYNYYPGGGDMVLDSADVLFNDLSSNSLYLRNTFAHEHGHGLGMRHSCPIEETKLMEPFLTTDFDGPQHDEVVGGNRGYGDPVEPNDASAAATPLGALGGGETLTVGGLSVDDELDADLFSFAVAAGSRASLSLRPLGTTYLAGPQSSSPCGPGVSYDSLRQQDLGVALIGPDGSSVIAFSDALPAGEVESLTDVSLASGAGTYHARVYGKTSNTVQLYELDLSVSTGPVSGSQLYESSDPALVVTPANAVGPVTQTPVDWFLTPGPLWFYQVDDGSGNPPLIRLVKGGSGLLVHIP